MMSARSLQVVWSLALLAVSASADAHAVTAGMSNFAAGVIHPLSSLENALPIFALGILAGQRGIRSTETMLVVFPLAFAAGATLALVVPDVRGVLLVNISSAVLLGGLVALAWRLPLAALHALAVLFGITHGYANGTALTPEMHALPFIGGLALFAFFWLATALTLTDLVLRQKPTWPPIAVRVLGSWIAAIGLLVLSIAHKTLLLS